MVVIARGEYGTDIAKLKCYSVLAWLDRNKYKYKSVISVD